MTPATVCVPIATGANPAATDAAEPEAAPPGVRCGSRGLRVAPGCKYPSSVVHRLAEDDSARRPQLRDYRRIVQRPAAGKYRRAKLGRIIAGIDDILDRYGNSVQWPDRLAVAAQFVERLSLGDDMLGIDVGEGLHRAVDGFDALKARAGVLFRRKRPVGDLACRLGRCQRGNPSFGGHQFEYSLSGSHSAICGKM